MEPRYTIGRLARAAGVPASTVRYYERSRLLRPDGRTAGNYRVYGREALERLRFIRAAQAIGLTLEDIATLLDFGEDRTANRDFVDERLGKIRTRKQEMEARLADLRRVDYQPVDLEVATRDSLAYLAKFRDVLEEDTLVQRKEFLHGFIAGIEIDPDAARGTITFAGRADRKAGCPSRRSAKSHDGRRLQQGISPPSSA